MTQRVIQPVILTTSARRESHVAAISAAFAAHPRFARPMVHCDEQQDGAAVATRDAISKAAAGGGHVLFLEDDVLVDPEAPALISCAAFPADVAVISFCDMREVPEYAPRGLYRCSALGADGRGWWGNQAILIHAECAAMSSREDWFSGPIQASPGIRTHVAAYGDGGRNCSDIRLSLCLLYTSPSPRD